MVDCKDCIHFRRLAGDTVWKRRTGCYHPENMEQKLTERVHLAQEIPGNHEQLNLRGDCAVFSARPRRGSVLSRMLEALRG
ncbi:MAG: hypothetical protein IT454_06035 [Planctomycetes bacterium]|nr:hypothetical protein [Planctomycetota bacterium]